MSAKTRLLEAVGFLKALGAVTNWFYDFFVIITVVFLGWLGLISFISLGLA